MKTRLLACLALLIAAGPLLSGCASRYERVRSTRPGGGIVRVFNKPKDIVFRAAVRVMNEQGEELWEAKKDTGRIVSLSTFGKRAIFLLPLSEGRTRVEISSDFSTSLFGGLSEKNGGFFTLLREQILIFEKKEAIQKASDRRRRVDPDLRTKYQKKPEAKEETPAPEPAPAPEPPSRFNRLRRGYN